MSENADNDQTSEVVVDELASLKARADQLNIQYHPSIGLEKLREKVNAVINADPVTTPAAAEPAPVAAATEETPAQRRARMRREANELVRIRVTCMNPAKKEWEGELFTSGNTTIGSFTKFVPFNADEGWHVPRIIYNQIIGRQCQIFVTQRDSRGNQTRKGKLIKEFAVEVLPALTLEELQELAMQQTATKAIEK